MIQLYSQPMTDTTAHTEVVERDGLLWEQHTGGLNSLGGWENVRGRNCEISFERRPHYCDRGNFVAKLRVTSTDPRSLFIDDSDGWPRYYFDETRGRQEIKAWLEKRGELPRQE